MKKELINLRRRRMSHIITNNKHTKMQTYAKQLMRDNFCLTFVVTKTKPKSNVRNEARRARSFLLTNYNKKKVAIKLDM